MIARINSELVVQGEGASGKLVATPLWPAPYNVDTPEAAYRFLTECCWTDNDADQVIELIPTKAYVRAVVQLWHAAYSSRTPMILEKSRRMVMSWVYRGLELWACGMKRSNWLVCDQDYAQSAKHVWRYHFMLEQMRMRRPELQVPAFQSRGSLSAHQLDMVILANGSTLSNANQEAGDLQGEGKTGITLEEFSRYRYPGRFWSQARFLTQGKAESRGGWVNAITNASANEEYRELKGFVSRVNPERCEVCRPSSLT
jgi:hypothetical protein